MLIYNVIIGTISSIKTRDNILSTKAILISANDSKAVNEVCQKSLESSKALDIVSIEVKEHSSITDIMMIATGTSNRHVCAIADRLVDHLSLHGIHGVRVSGTEEGKWVLVDIGSVIVHIMQEADRERYQLETLYKAVAAGISEWE